jgi:hypothetical protein
MANFSKLIGLDIKEARKKIGEWWVCSGPHWPNYTFERAAGARLELTTDEKNVVVQEWHNYMAEVYTKNENY